MICKWYYFSFMQKGKIKTVLHSYCNNTFKLDHSKDKICHTCGKKVSIVPMSNRTKTKIKLMEQI